MHHRVSKHLQREFALKQVISVAKQEQILPHRGNQPGGKKDSDNKKN